MALKSSVVSINLLLKKAKKRKSDVVDISLTHPLIENFGSIIYGTDESELILQPHFHFRY
ncbi:hypothetical protein EXW12_09420 [Enterococcus faecium]|nr:hypothetical protein [Enterococcus faecium]